MFTGIITAQATLSAISHSAAASSRTLSFSIDSSVGELILGESISHNGICLTIFDIEHGTPAHSYRAEVSHETLAVTTVSSWQVGDRINFEQSLRLGDRVGGHMVSGHVDGVAKVVRVIQNGIDSTDFAIGFERPIGRYLCRKGSVALDGVSLTVNDISAANGIDAIDGMHGEELRVTIISHSLSVTNISTWRAGTLVNIEVDSLARSIERLIPHYLEKIS